MPFLVLESDPIDGILNEVRRRGISALVEEVEMGFCRWALINEANTIYHKIGEKAFILCR